MNRAFRGLPTVSRVRWMSDRNLKYKVREDWTRVISSRADGEGSPPRQPGSGGGSSRLRGSEDRSLGLATDHALHRSSLMALGSPGRSRIHGSGTIASRFIVRDFSERRKRSHIHITSGISPSAAGFS